ncbi:MAG: hypothetical protein COA32_00200 [Fluviicola sp.]|nr:MAG: hypothetical protein COA32_00200 [Fluviicola sp.]
MLKMKLPKNLLSVLFFLLLLGCEKNIESNLTYQKSKLKYSFIETQRELLAIINSSGGAYMNKVSFFSNLPAQYALEDCQSTWKIWYNQFLLLTPYRYIDSEFNIGFDENQSYFDLSGINYGYVDYTVNQPNGGIIKDPVNYPNINQVGMISWHQLGDEKNASLGFHVLEFLLWGEDLSLSSTGIRDNSDYLQTNSENQRRMNYLLDASSYLKLIVNDLNVSSSYKKNFLKSDADESFTYILEGYNRFIQEDLIDKTILKPLNSQDPFEELSNFSDNTLANIKSKVQGLKYALDGSELFIESETDGYFMIDFISEVDNESAQNILNSLDRIDASLSQITISFENAIQNTSMSEKLSTVVSELNNIKSVLSTLKENYFNL